MDLSDSALDCLPAAEDVGPRPPADAPAAPGSASAAAASAAAAVPVATAAPATSVMSVPPQPTPVHQIVDAHQTLDVRKEGDVVRAFRAHPAIEALPEKQRFNGGRPGGDLDSIKAKWFLGERGSAQYDPSNRKSREKGAREKAKKFFEQLATVDDWDKIATKFKVGTGVLLEMRQRQPGVGGSDHPITNEDT